MTERSILTVKIREKNPRHWHLAVYNRGGLSGNLVVNAEDGAAIVEILSPDTAGVRDAQLELPSV